MLKPLKLQRITQTLNRFTDLKINRSQNELNDMSVKTQEVLDRIYIESEGISYIINIHDIIFITRYDRKVLIVTKNKNYSIWTSIKNLEKRLPDNFFRSHKGYIINLNYINEIRLMSKKTYTVYFNGCTETALMTFDKSNIIKERYCL